MKKTEIKTTTYSYVKEYLVDIVETENDYEAYVYSKDNCYKIFMFGCPKEQQTKDEFIDMVKASMDDFISDYEHEIYEDEEWE